MLGPDHPGTLRTRSNIAVWRGKAGDAAGAAAAFQALLTDQLRVLGPDHPDTQRDSIAGPPCPMLTSTFRWEDG